MLASVPSAHAYSVLSHEAIIDSAWDSALKPLLLARFPDSTGDQLRRAHAFAYGGAIIQDAGYYPGGSKLFTDLTHYVRAADFILALLRDSQDLDEYAFALGALAHYAADTDGHSIAVNPSVPLLYPRVRKRFGHLATYEDNPTDHVRTEFGFDVLEVAKQRYAPDAYHEHIGFEVATPLLERAFEQTYGVSLRSLFADLDRAIGTYRYDVSKLIPRATKAAWLLKKGQIQSDLPTMTERQFLFNISRASYEKRWGRNYQRPGFSTQLLALLIRILPKVGPLRVLEFHTPTPQTENLFMASFNDTLRDYQRLLAERRADRLSMRNVNLDTGQPMRPGEYFLADQAYAQLVDRLAKNHFSNLSPELREDILGYYGDGSAPIATKKKRKQWALLETELQQLRASAVSPASNAQEPPW